jgi:plastocyanin
MADSTKWLLLIFCSILIIAASVFISLLRESPISPAIEQSNFNRNSAENPTGSFSIPSEENPIRTIPPTLALGIGSTAFSGTIQINRGTKIIWVNNDTSSHTVTSLDGKFDSGIINPGEHFEKLFKENGDFSYYCSFHQTEKAFVIVAD